MEKPGNLKRDERASRCSEWKQGRDGQTRDGPGLKGKGEILESCN
jgi:hypothetical protein